MDGFLALLVVFGALIALGTAVNIYLFNSGALGTQRFRRFRRRRTARYLPVEAEALVDEDEYDAL